MKRKEKEDEARERDREMKEEKRRKQLNLCGFSSLATSSYKKYAIAPLR